MSRKTRKLDRLFAAAAAPACTYCRRPLTRATASLDHETPKRDGGTLAVTNLALACQPCNSRKGAMTAEAFRRWLFGCDGQVYLARKAAPLRPLHRRRVVAPSR